MYIESGTASNYLCLPQNPDFDSKIDQKSPFAMIYGAEYETHTFVSGLTDKEAPCAVCQIPRSNVIMMPGKNICLKNYKMEYHGYLMSGHPKHVAASEYVCVDGDPEATTESLPSNLNGVLFYFVKAKCGSLKCLPYKDGEVLTSVVCSYSP
ncbi:uncharacterized protein LOC132756554 [Ruditapes philippinarum]|uniref:uncharacterized protein LOC132756554 n=1 Tax=Ruditapes philippinarum TaxID=129788 RepID=UPI00295AD640|nr:uncharacterized protein LOC132756554 [Ruditapes philippinarum]